MEASTSSNLNIAQYLPQTVPLETAMRILSLTDVHMLEDGSRTDITLQAEGGYLQAHRFILASSSPTLKSHFETYRQRWMTFSPTMTIQGLELLLILLYSVNNLVSVSQLFRGALDEHFDEIFNACHALKIIRLAPVLNEFLPRHLSRENCWKWHQMSLDLFEVCRGTGLEGQCYLPEICGKFIMENGGFIEQLRIC